MCQSEATCQLIQERIQVMEKTVFRLTRLFITATGPRLTLGWDYAVAYV